MNDLVNEKALFLSEAFAALRARKNDLALLVLLWFKTSDFVVHAFVAVRADVGALQVAALVFLERLLLSEGFPAHRTRIGAPPFTDYFATLRGFIRRTVCTIYSDGVQVIIRFLEIGGIYRNMIGG